MWHPLLVDLELRRADGDRRLYLLDGVGTLRLTGFFARSAVAEADGRRWSFGRSGFWRNVIRASEASEVGVGEFEPRTFKRGGPLRWESRRLTLSPASLWRSRYALVEDGRELATLDSKGWGRRPVAVTVGEVVDPGLLLFAAFVVRSLASDDGSSAAVTSSTAASS